MKMVRAVFFAAGESLRDALGVNALTACGILRHNPSQNGCVVGTGNGEDKCVVSRGLRVSRTRRAGVCPEPSPIESTKRFRIADLTSRGFSKAAWRRCAPCV